MIEAQPIQELGDRAEGAAGSVNVNSNPSYYFTARNLFRDSVWRSRVSGLSRGDKSVIARGYYGSNSVHTVRREAKKVFESQRKWCLSWLIHGYLKQKKTRLTFGRKVLRIANCPPAGVISFKWILKAGGWARGSVRQRLCSIPRLCPHCYQRELGERYVRLVQVLQTYQPTITGLAIVEQEEMLSGMPTLANVNAAIGRLSKKVTSLVKDYCGKVVVGSLDSRPIFPTAGGFTVRVTRLVALTGSSPKFLPTAAIPYVRTENPEWVELFSSRFRCPDTLMEFYNTEQQVHLAVLSEEDKWPRLLVSTGALRHNSHCGLWL